MARPFTPPPLLMARPLRDDFFAASFRDYTLYFFFIDKNTKLFIPFPTLTLNKTYILNGHVR